MSHSAALGQPARGRLSAGNDRGGRVCGGRQHLQVSCERLHGTHCSFVELSLMNVLQGPHHRGVRLGEGGFPRPNSLRGLWQLGVGDLGQGVQAAGRLLEAAAARHAVLAQPGKMMGSDYATSTNAVEKS